MLLLNVKVEKNKQKNEINFPSFYKNTVDKINPRGEKKQKAVKAFKYLWCQNLELCLYCTFYVDM